MLVVGPFLEAQELHRTIRSAQQNVVKLYGAGGLRQMEAYQTGILISAEGHILTAMSYVLDTDDLVAVLDDGRKLHPEIVGTDPIRELAVLRPKSEQSGLPYFDLSASVSGHTGQRVLAVSNLYGIATGDEAASVLQGVITAVAPLDARRGAQQTQYRGEVYVLDAQSNNPGAAGGALVDWRGNLIGLLGKELRSRMTGTWLNYALPATDLVPVVADIIAGREVEGIADSTLPPESAMTTADLGFMLVPDVLRRTPPYVDAVLPYSSAAKAGMQADDLVVFVGDDPVVSCLALNRQLSRLEKEEGVTISVLRDGTLYVFDLVVNNKEESIADDPQQGAQENATERDEIKP